MRNAEMTTGIHGKPLYWIKGVLVLLVVLVVVYFIGGPLQYLYGVWGLLYTELMILLIAVSGMLALRIDCKVMLRIQAPSIRQFIGLILMVVAGGVMAACAGYVGFLFRPQGLEFIKTFESMTSGAPPVTTWLIIALSPAICEEILHRGVILYTFSHSHIQKRWVIVLWMGLLFGLFHLDPSRFFVTSILGMTLTYIMLETENMLMPMLYHLLNNTTSVLPSILNPNTPSSMSQGMEELTGMLPTMAGSFLILSAFALFVLRLGARLIGPGMHNRCEEEKAMIRTNRNNNRLITAVVSIFLLVAGVWMLMQQDSFG